MNYIVKTINGKPVKFGVSYEGSAPVYVFQEKADFDAAVAANTIPVGALIVKTYDAIETAGGTE